MTNDKIVHLYLDFSVLQSVDQTANYPKKKIKKNITIKLWVHADRCDDDDGGDGGVSWILSWNIASHRDSIQFLSLGYNIVFRWQFASDRISENVKLISI